jgi:glycogen debranching enzyme
VPANAYRCPPERLLTGASLGNLEMFLKLTPESDVAALWSALDTQIYCGRWLAQIYVAGERASAVETIHAPAYQETAYRGGGLNIRKRTFLPFRESMLQIAYMTISMENPTTAPIDAAIICDVHYPAFVWPGVYKVPDITQRNKRVENVERNGAVVSSTAGRETEVRVFGADVAPVSTNLNDRGLNQAYSATVPARSTRTIAMRMAISNVGAEAALRLFEDAPSAAAALVETEASYERVHRTGYVRTPDAAINRAIDWAKINSIRVQQRYPAGFGFTNDPPQDVVVVRDAAWYVMGSDYLTPGFSREMLLLVKRYGVEPGGKITEFMNACEIPPRKSDYGLNINDDTPLVVSAVYHHFAVTHDRSALDLLWPMARDATEWILSQRRDGLVYATSQEANVWGIAGWRNIIPQGQISGAVTEINSECVYALRLAARLARFLGFGADADRYSKAGDDLRAAVNTRLISEKTGLYLLNIDPDGTRHHSVTGDQIFPVMFGVADDDLKRKILDRLYSPEFWTPYGVRTVSNLEDGYDPDHGVHLLGGVWPNLTAWVGYSGKGYSTRRLVTAMRNIWKISEVENPKAYYNVVPGEFPERLSGETFKSRGMAMSPWMPPTYVWLAYEGLLGLEPSLAGLRINPHLPDDWSWVAASDVPVMNGKLSFFYYRRRLHATMPVGSKSKTVIYDEDVSRFIECDAPFSVALREGDAGVVFVATDTAGTFSLRIKPPLVAAEEKHTVVLRDGSSKLFDLRAIAKRGAHGKVSV